ncbi:MAG: hypothetical protein D5S00_08915 [Tindallia sp. MSAO_Bac2]|nr:MAG: hypothetical protein D5S00_08915 [Tindallia sp. MSAO_Bac2]
MELKYWEKCCRRIVDGTSQENNVEPHHVFLWLLARLTSTPSDLNESSGFLSCMAQSNCQRLKLMFDKLDKVVDDEEISEIKGANIPPAFELENIYQEILKGSYKEQTGSFYTGRDIAGFMVCQSLEDLLVEAKTGTSAADRLEFLKKISIIDISCGGGTFLRESYGQLLKMQQELCMELGLQTSAEALAYHILENQLTGIDSQAEAVVLAEILIRLELPPAIRWSAKVQLYCEDGLLWKSEAGSKYDLVIGNPPYIGEKGNRSIFKEIKNTEFGKKYYERSMDYFYFFIYRGAELLKKNGCLCYVTTSYFATADGANQLREHMKNHLQFRWIIQLGDIKVFERAKGQHNLIYSLSKKDVSNTSPVKILYLEHYKGTVNELFNALNKKGLKAEIPGGNLIQHDSANNLFDERGQLLLKYSIIEKNVLENITNKTLYRLKDFCEINQGLVSGADKVTEKHAKMEKNWEPGDGIFVLSQNEVEKLKLSPTEKKLLKFFHKNSDIVPFRVRNRDDQFILYITDKNVPDIECYPSLHKHLYRYRSILEKRREVQKNIRNWYSLHWPRRETLFDNSKIVVPQRAAYNVFALAPCSWYASADVYYIQLKPDAWFSEYYLLGWLNSSLCLTWLSYYGKTKGNDLELYATPLKSLPVPVPKSNCMEAEVVALVKAMMQEDDIDEEEREKNWNHLDCLFLKWYGVSDEQAALINKEAVVRRRNSRRRNWT